MYFNYLGKRDIYEKLLVSATLKVQPIIILITLLEGVSDNMDGALVEAFDSPPIDKIYEIDLVSMDPGGHHNSDGDSSGEDKKKGRRKLQQ